MMNRQNTVKKPIWGFCEDGVRFYTNTSSFFGIGILPVSDLTGRSVFRSVLLVWWELLFSAKGGLAVSKRGPVQPLSGGK
jgi:hypothetical protein